MTRKRKLLASLTMFCALLAVTTQALARDVMTLVPEGALGFAVVNNLASTTAKADKLASQFKAPFPPLLTELKEQTGIEEGLDEKGNLLIVFMPGAERLDEPKPLLALPVSDYKKVVTQLGGNTSDEITEVQVAGTALLAAKVDSHAVFVDAESKSLLTKLLESDAKVDAAVKPLAEWATKQDAAVAVLPAGLRLAIGEGIKGLEEAQDNIPSEGPTAQVAEALNIYIDMLKMIRDDVNAAALGVQVGDSGHLELVARVGLTPEGKLAKVAEAGNLVLEKPLHDIPAGEYVFAGSSAWSAKLSDAYMRWSLELMKSSGAIYGWDELSDADRENILKSSGEAMKGFKSFGFFMGIGADTDPIYSNIFFVGKVTDSARFIESYEKALAQWNKAMESNEKSATMKYDVEKIKFEGTDGLKLSMDINALMASQLEGNPDAAMAMQQMMGMMFGQDGKLLTFILPSGDENILGGIGTLEQMQELDKSLKSDKRLGQNSQVATTAALLPKDACAVGYLNPQGAVKWVSRIVAQVLPVGQVPEFPETPPLGFASKVSKQNIDLHLVVPKETAEGISKYIEGLSEQQEERF